MQVKVSVRHGHLDDDAQTTIREKAEKLLTYFDRITMIEVTIDLSGDDKKAEVLLDAEHKHNFVSQAESPDPLTAVAVAVDKMKHQLMHYKQKIQDHRRDPSHGGNGGVKP